MDLLGDIGTNDQLIATRSENDVLKRTVTKLTQQVQELTLQLTMAQAELDLYRHHGTNDSIPTSSNDDDDHPVTTISSIHNPNNVGASSTGPLPYGNCGALIGMDHNNIHHSMPYCHVPKRILSNIHDNSNPVCISLIVVTNENDTDNSGQMIIVTGGESDIAYANGFLQLSFPSWVSVKSPKRLWPRNLSDFLESVLLDSLVVL